MIYKDGTRYYTLKEAAKMLEGVVCYNTLYAWTHKCMIDYITFSDVKSAWKYLSEDTINALKGSRE